MQRSEANLESLNEDRRRLQIELNKLRQQQQEQQQQEEEQSRSRVRTRTIETFERETRNMAETTEIDKVTLILEKLEQNAQDLDQLTRQIFASCDTNRDQ